MLMKTIIITLLLCIPLVVNSVTYKYMYTSKDVSDTAVLKTDGGVTTTLDMDSEIITVSSDVGIIKFAIVGLKTYTEEEVTFYVKAAGKPVSIFSFYPDYIVFRYGELNFILIDIPKKYW